MALPLHLFIRSLNKYLLKTLFVLDAGDNRLNKTQSQCSQAASLVTKYSRFCLDWALPIYIGLCLPERSLIHELMSFLCVAVTACNTAYKSYMLCLLEEFDEMAQYYYLLKKRIYIS